MRSSKRMRGAREAVEPGRTYTLDEALELLQKLPKVKFDETVELAVHTGLDPKKTDQPFRGSVSLPRGLGRTRTVAVFAEGPEAEQAEAAGADIVGGAELVEKVQGGFTDFDVAVATPAMMRHVGKLGRILGPQGKMPTPKAGTVTNAVGEAVDQFKKGRIDYRLDAGANLHASVGKRSFSGEALHENLVALLEHYKAHKPQGAKGQLFLSATLSSTMGPGIPLNTTKF